MFSDDVRLNGVSSVKQTDIVITNGVIHLVNAVIGLPTVVSRAAANQNFTTLVGLLDGQGLVPTLNGTTNSSFTVFTTSNTGFETFETRNIETLANFTFAQVTSVLAYPVLAVAKVLASGSSTITITTLKTRTFTIAGIVITDEENRNIVAFDV